VLELLFDAGEEGAEPGDIEADGVEEDRLAQGALLWVEEVVAGDAADGDHGGV
jgi:hypothetical protein